MNGHMKPETEVLEEGVFEFKELFFSRTNKNGIIASGNDIFRRVSGYDWQELIGQPHNIIRHPDMPRAVFYLLWETIQQGKPIGAYVKNNSKNNKPYWVFALAMPIDDGYLSIRLKPSSQYFDIIQKEYASLREIELRDRISPKESLSHLSSRITALGFESYEHFMLESMTKEILGRQTQTGENNNEYIQSLSKMISYGDDLLKDTRLVFNSYTDAKFIPVNLAIKATHINPAENVIGVIANYYQKMISEAETVLKSFQETAAKVLQHLRSNQFFLCSHFLQNQTIAYFSNQNSSGEVDSKIEMQILNDLNNKYLNQTSRSLQEVKNLLKTFCESTTRLRAAITSLEIVRLKSKIEVSKLENGSEFDVVNEELRTFQESTGKTILVLEKTTRDMSVIANKILESL